MAEFKYQERFIKNSEGTKLFACRWLPAGRSPKALIFLCHGYGAECSGYMRDYGVRIALARYAVFGMDCEGHGQSEGPRCYINNFDNVVDDYYEFYKSITEREEYKGKKKFLLGEAMGGAAALLLHKRDPSFWDGAILVGPMCKISEKVKPHPALVNLLTKVEFLIPKWKIVPSKDVIDSACKDPVKREKIRNNKLIYQGRPRLRTALELLRTSMTLEETLEEVKLPFLVLHGEADTVTDPELSKALYERASSTDKQIKLYEGMWHSLTSEPDENVGIVFEDIISWLDEHTTESEPHFVNTEPVDSFNFGNKESRAAEPAASLEKKVLSQRQLSGRPLSAGQSRRSLHHLLCKPYDSDGCGEQT